MKIYKYNVDRTYQLEELGCMIEKLINVAKSCIMMEEYPR